MLARLRARAGPSFSKGLARVSAVFSSHPYISNGAVGFSVAALGDLLCQNAEAKARALQKQGEEAEEDSGNGKEEGVDWKRTLANGCFTGFMYSAVVPKYCKQTLLCITFPSPRLISSLCPDL